MELESSLSRYAKADGADRTADEARTSQVDVDESSQTPHASTEAQTARVMEVDGEDETEEDRLANEHAYRLKTLADKMEGFVEGEGVMEGAVFDE
jgi:hypothetical protein